MSEHSTNSSYREKLIEHLFIGELLKISWAEGSCLLEIGKPEVDNAGYDLIAEANGIIRHIQLKTSHLGSRTANQKVHIKLADKPSGCVVWIYFNEKTLELGPYYFLGSLGGGPLSDISDARVARHTKGNKTGYKAERPNIRIVSKGKFTPYSSTTELYSALFDG